MPSLLRQGVLLTSALPSPWHTASAATGWGGQWLLDILAQMLLSLGSSVWGLSAFLPVPPSSQPELRPHRWIPMVEEGRLWERAHRL